MLEMLAVMDEMAQKIQELDTDLDELDEYVASMESDLSDVEDLLFSTGTKGRWKDDYEEIRRGRGSLRQLPALRQGVYDQGRGHQLRRRRPLPGLRKKHPGYGRRMRS